MCTGEGGIPYSEKQAAHSAPFSHLRAREPPPPAISAGGSSGALHSESRRPARVSTSVIELQHHLWTPREETRSLKLTRATTLPSILTVITCSFSVGYLCSFRSHTSISFLVLLFSGNVPISVNYTLRSSYVVRADRFTYIILSCFFHRLAPKTNKHCFFLVAL